VTLTAVVLLGALTMAVLIGVLAGTVSRRASQPSFIIGAEGRAPGAADRGHSRHQHGEVARDRAAAVPRLGPALGRRGRAPASRSAAFSASARTISAGIEKIMIVAVIFVGVKPDLQRPSLTVGALVGFFRYWRRRVTNPLVQISSLISEFQEVAPPPCACSASS